MTWIVPILGLLGTLAASTLVSEWFKRRDLRESIKSDLEVYEKLPDCEAKTELLGFVEVRVRRLMKAKQPAPAVVTHFVGSIISMGILVTIMTISGAYKWARDQRGVLWLHLGDGTSMTFLSATIFAALLVIAVPVLFVLGNFLIDQLLAVLRSLRAGITRLTRRRSPKPTAAQTS